MAQWKKGESGNLKGRPRTGAAIADLARKQIDRHRLVDELGRIAARQGEYAEVDVGQQLRAMQLLLSYGYGPPRVEVEAGNGELKIEVSYVQNNQIAITCASSGAISDHSRSQALQRGLLRTPLREVSARDGQADPSGAEG